MQRPLVVDWGEFLSQFRWDWFVTLTFEGDVKSFTAYLRCARWLKALEKAAGNPIAWFRADEYGDRLGKFHLHLLIANVAHRHRFTWMGKWEKDNGFARIFPFDPHKGAAFYVSKYVTKQLGEWEISDNLEAFRVQQTVLKLVRQRGAPPTGKGRDARRLDTRVATETPRRTKQGDEQLVISDFTEADSSEIDLDPVRASFREQTKPRRR